MSYNIDSIETLSSTLRISQKNAKRAKRIYMPEGNPIEGLVFGEDGYAKIERFEWCGECSGNAYHDGRLERLVKLLEGDADLILTWEGGDSHTGLRIRSGKMTECDVIMTLAPEEP